MNPRYAPVVLALSIGWLASGCWLLHGRDAGRDVGARDAGPTHVDAAAAVDAALPPGPSCPAGGAYFEPGCGSGEVRIVPGCYQPCLGADDPSCGSALTCRQTDINPCVCTAGTACCGACGAQQWLCLPPTPPVPVDCAGRGYCDCTGGCVPLIDLTHGCVCECDEPFSCGGPPCDCACGGASYLGCAAVGACASTEVTCGSDALGGLVAGCPECIGGI